MSWKGLGFEIEGEDLRIWDGMKGVEGTWHSLHLLLWRLMCCSARTRLLMREASMFSRKLFSSSLAPTKGLLLHSRRPAARASSIGAAEGSQRACQRYRYSVLQSKHDIAMAWHAGCGVSGL